MKKLFWKLLLCGLPMMLTFASCGDDDGPEAKTIYGTYDGTCHLEASSTEDNSVIANETSEAQMKIAEQNGKMALSIYNENLNVKYMLPALNASGTSSYHYQFTSGDGLSSFDITSPDFNSITVRIESTDTDEQQRLEIAFRGVRK